MPPVIEADGVSKRFFLYHNRSTSLKERFLAVWHRNRREVVEEFWALKDVSLAIDPGEALGLVGRNGSGKSTLLKLIAGIHRPTSGRLDVAQGAHIGTMIELGLGFHPELSGTENVFLSAAIHGLTRLEIESIYDRIVEYSGLHHFMDVPLKNYSSGMHMRLGFAIAANLEPDILLIDEIFAVGDEDFQKKCLKTMQQFGSEGTTIVFVSHTPAAVQTICRRACVLDHGRLLYDGSVEGALEQYHRLLQSSAVETETPLPSGSPVAPPVVEGDRAAEGVMPAADLESEEALLEALKREGLTPDHRVLRIGLMASLVNGAFARYVGRDRFAEASCSPDRRSPDTHAIDGQFEFIVAPSLFTHLNLNGVARSMAMALKQLSHGGRLYATYFENPHVTDFDPIPRRGGLLTYPDDEPYHYAFAMIDQIAQALGARAERVGGFAHPAGESLVVITPGCRAPSTASHGDSQTHPPR